MLAVRSHDVQHRTVGDCRLNADNLKGTAAMIVADEASIRTYDRFELSRFVIAAIVDYALSVRKSVVGMLKKGRSSRSKVPFSN